VFLFQPPTAWRFRWNKNTDTPMPPDEPAAPNPPDGVTISYLIGANTAGPVTLDIVEPTSGEIVRHYSSDDPEEVPVAGRNIPDYWIRPPQRLAATPGLHRFVWDGRFAPPAVDAPTYPIAAVRRNTPQSPQGMWVTPGTYQVRLSVAGRLYRQAVTMRMDPRVKASGPDLMLQYTLSRSLDRMMRRVATVRRDFEAQRARGNSAEAPGQAAIGDELQRVHDAVGTLFESIQSADARPTAAQEAAAVAALTAAEAAIAKVR
jgi:hypothetical protein